MRNVIAGAFFLFFTFSSVNAHEETKKKHYSWKEVEEAAVKLHSKLPKKKWDGILAITRGGLAPALLMSQMLDMRQIKVINIKSYNAAKERGHIQVADIPVLEHDGKNWLVLDDLSDSGATIRAVRQLYPNAYYATLYAKPVGVPDIHAFGIMTEQNTWIVFPWEEFERTAENQ